MKFNLRERIFQIWYRYVNSIDKNAEILLMNYGYHNEDQQLVLKAEDEPNRYSIQLYDHLATAVELKNLDIVEIGSGRGGGLYYVFNTHKPGSALGIELDKSAVRFCNAYYQSKGLTFWHGDAQQLTLQNECTDVVLNVESSHRYPDMPAFLREAYRILRPGGYLLLTDFRSKQEIPKMQHHLKKSGMTIQREQVINKQVLEALKLDDPRKRRLVKKLAPKFLHKTAMNFAATIDSKTYRKIESGEFIYFSYVLQKDKP